MAKQIESYQFGRIVIDGQAYTADLILLPDRILDGWWRQEGHVLHPADLDAVFDAGPDLLIVGQGAYGRMRVADETARRTPKRTPSPSCCRRPSATR